MIGFVAWCASAAASLGGAIVLVVVLVALLAPWLAPHPFDETDLLNAWAPPDALNLLGTDKLGRDIASRLIVGARVSLAVALSVLAITLLVGVTAGLLAGYFGGRRGCGAHAHRRYRARVSRGRARDPRSPRCSGRGLPTVIVTLSLVWWPGIARLTRSLVLAQKQETYVEAADRVRRARRQRSCGATSCRTSPVRCWCARRSGVGFIIMAEATLSFLGLGVQEPTPSWGGMIRDGLPALRSDPTLAVSAASSSASPSSASTCSATGCATRSIRSCGDGDRREYAAHDRHRAHALLRASRPCR